MAIKFEIINNDWIVYKLNSDTVGVRISSVKQFRISRKEITLFQTPGRPGVTFNYGDNEKEQFESDIKLLQDLLFKKQ